MEPRADPKSSLSCGLDLKRRVVQVLVNFSASHNFFKELEGEPIFRVGRHSALVKVVNFKDKETYRVV